MNMKKLITLFFLMLAINVSALDAKFEIGMFHGKSERYFDSFFIKNDVFYAVTGKKVREMGPIECIAEDVCSGGPYLNDSDLPEILNVTVVFNSRTGYDAIVSAFLDDEQLYFLTLKD